jgi:hypothetical protein
MNSKLGLVKARLLLGDDFQIEKWLSLESTKTLLMYLGEHHLYIDTSNTVWFSRPLSIAFAAWVSPALYVKVLYNKVGRKEENEDDEKSNNYTSEEEEEETKSETDQEEEEEEEEEEEDQEEKEYCSEDDEEGRLIDELVAVLTKAIEYRSREDKSENDWFKQKKEK